MIASLGMYDFGPVMAVNDRLWALIRDRLRGDGIDAPDALNTPVIEIRDLHKSMGQLEVIKGVSLTAPRGHVISLIGSSGSGKSTLLRCCNLLEKDSQQGDILFEARPCAGRAGPGPRARRPRAGDAHPHQPVDGVSAVQPVVAHDHPAKRDGSARSPC
jgi:ABC-type glutathione transport system ATPase component